MKPIVLRDGLELHAPGAVFVPHERTLVIADVHVGYTRTLRARGYGVPAASDDGLQARLETLFARVNPAHVIIAGDLVHGAPSASGETDSPLARFLGYLAPREVTVVLGNHDRHIREWLASNGVRSTTELTIGPHRVHHGDDPDRVRALRQEALDSGGRVLIGHLHPAARVSGAAGVSALLPAFVTAHGFVCLPAFSQYAHGVDLEDDRLGRDLHALVGDTDLGAACVATETTVVALGVFSRRAV